MAVSPDNNTILCYGSEYELSCVSMITNFRLGIRVDAKKEG